MKYAINCKMEDEAEKLLSFLDSKGFEWKSGHNLNKFTNWEFEKENTCYTLDYQEWDKIVMVTSINELNRNELEIISTKDFINNYQKYTNGFFGE